MRYFVYVLKCPITKEIRYVGQTADVGPRLGAHLSDKKKSDKSGWIQGLMAMGLSPEIEVIEECDRDSRFERESFHVKTLRSAGVELLNWVRPGPRCSTEKKRKIPRLVLTEESLGDLITAAALAGEDRKDMAARLFKAERLLQFERYQNKEKA